MSVKPVRYYYPTSHVCIKRVHHGKSSVLAGTKSYGKQFLPIPCEVPHATSENERNSEKEQRNCSHKHTLTENRHVPKSDISLPLREWCPIEVSRRCNFENDACSHASETILKPVTTAINHRINMCHEDISLASAANISSTFQGKVPKKEFDINEILEGVVLVGCWNTRKNTIESLGTGFFIDKTNGLIATAAHIFHELYFGTVGKLKFGTPIIGIVSKGSKRKTFTYCAEIQAVNISTADACILRVTKKFKNPIELNGAIFDRPQNAIELRSFREEKLYNLTLTTKNELSEDISLIAFDKNVYNGYITGVMNTNCPKRKNLNKFQPKSEIVIKCVTHDGWSGGPCVNSKGKVVGMLSRTDRNDNRISYLVPSSKLKKLLQLC